MFTDALIVADSITKEIGDCKQTHLLTFRGATVKTLLQKLQALDFANSAYQCIIIHVGTNDFRSATEWRKYVAMINGKISPQVYDEFIALGNPSDGNFSLDQFEKDYGKILDLLRSMFSDTWVMCSPVLPRYWDHLRRDDLRRKVNERIKHACEVRQYRMVYLESYRMFFADLSSNKLKEWYFSPDGLHLSDHGVRALRTFFLDKINKVIKGVIKDRKM